MSETPPDDYERLLFKSAIQRDYPALDQALALARRFPTDSPALKFAFSYALTHRRLDAAAGLLEAHYPGRCPPPPMALLSQAAAGYDEAMASLLLARGADPNALDHFGARPLSYVCEKTCEGDRHRAMSAILRALLAAGADPSLADDLGDTPLGLAAKSLWAEGVAILLAAGADPNALGGSGLSPLALAASRCKSLGFEEAALALAAGGADPGLPVRIASNKGPDRLQSPLGLIEELFPSLARCFSPRLISAYESHALGALPPAARKPGSRL